MRVAFLVIALQLWSVSFVWANNPSYRLAHPIAWMHLPPVGEQPGWSSSAWFNLEINHSNVWNASLDMIDKRNGNSLNYEADFEQTTTLIEVGGAVSNRWSVSTEIPYTSRGGGFLDDFIDQFHQFIGTDRFLRHVNPAFDRTFRAETNGQDSLSRQSPSGVGNLKLKTKYWLWQWKGSANGSCSCGMSLGAQVKFPIGAGYSSLTSGYNDYTLTAHMGAPLFKASAIWATAGFSALGKNRSFSEWPMRRWAQMYELSIDFALTNSWGLLLQARTESPTMNKGDLEINYPYSDPSSQRAYRVASGWNSLVYWRSSESAGFRWRSTKGHQVNLLVIEDWGLGDQDYKSDQRYVNNAPDVGFVLQSYIKF